MWTAVLLDMARVLYRMYGSISPVAYLDLPQPFISTTPANVSLRSHNRRRHARCNQPPEEEQADGRRMPLV